MSRPMIALADMPAWPRFLSEEEAASYVRISRTTFRNGVGTLWPKAIRIGRRKLYDRHALDRAVDALAPSATESPAKELDRGRQHDSGGPLEAR